MIELNDLLAKKYTQSELAKQPYLFFKGLVCPARDIFSSHPSYQNDDFIMTARELTQDIYDIFKAKDQAYARFADLLDHYLGQLRKTIAIVENKIEFFE